MKISSALLLLSALLAACTTAELKEPPLVVREDPAQIAAKAAKIRSEVPIEIAQGLEINLWASDSLAPDPIGLDVDRFGKVYLTRTNRSKSSEFDIRRHSDWKIESIGFQSVEDRKDFLHREFSPENTEKNEWLPDLNRDGTHDWKDLAVLKEEVWKLEDTDGDGFADISTQIVNDFNEEITDVAGALLVRDDDIFVGVAPDMWRMWDEDGDGAMDGKESIATGFGVHIGFSGHGMSGAIQGPDGRIYWGIGDIGANITAMDGSVHEYPNQGVLVRSEPDGSNFEVFASGLRNTHEFTFDKYGNIIGADNDGDHPGEKERLVYLVEGSDAGWRSNWQYGKYEDPKNNTYKVWMDEKMFLPRWEGQAAHIIPPIANYHNGPAGMTYNPGTALGKKWKDKFFLVEFVGSAANSRVWAFDLNPSGASFELGSEEIVVEGILPTGIRFGPDGAMYLADWIMGWNTKNYGRVWRMDVTPATNDLMKQRATTSEWMKSNLGEESLESLEILLEYPDMRVRQRAQFELVSRGDQGLTVFTASLNSSDQLARIHSIWGLGQLHRSGLSTVSLIRPLLSDDDPEIVAQAAKVLGDIRDQGSSSQLLELLVHEKPRVRFFAAEALGRLEEVEAITPLIGLIHENNDEDLYLRHAAVLALTRIGAEEAMASLAYDPCNSARLAALLVLRRLGSPEIEKFLSDSSEYIVTEAARAINDDLSIEDALPALAGLLEDRRYSSEPIMRRAINAALRVGNSRSLELLMDYASRTEAPAILRKEALEALSVWPSPSVTDRVDGRYRGTISRDLVEVQLKTTPLVRSLLNDKEPEVAASAAKMVGMLRMGELWSEIMDSFENSPYPEVRVAALNSVLEISEEIDESIITRSLQDESEDVRSIGISQLANTQVEAEELAKMRKLLFQKGSILEKQQFISSLGEMEEDISGSILTAMVAEMSSGELDRSVWLDLGKAVNQLGNDELAKSFEQTREGLIGLEAWNDVLYGGSVSAGQRYFYTNSTGQCTRCHRTGAEGADVGPVLATIGDRLTREQILEALVDPTARLAPGFGSVKLSLTDGTEVTGILMEDSDTQIVLKTNEAEPLEIPKDRISDRQNLPSAMPPMGAIMEREELRDLIEFLSQLNEN